VVALATVRDALVVPEDLIDLRNVTAYARLLCEKWAEGRTFIVNEADVAGTPDLLVALYECAKPWCVHEYPIHGMLYAPTLGLAKFSGGMTATWPMLANRALTDHWPVGALCHWRQCSERLATELQRYGFRPHVHQPPARHFHRYDPPGGLTGA
jgi:hypothetical protein